MDDKDAVEKHLDYLLQKAMIEMHDCADMRDGMQALIQAMNFMAQYMKDYQKEMHDGQAHQQSKERRREEKPTESEEGFENPYHCRQEDGSEDAEVQDKDWQQQHLKGLCNHTIAQSHSFYGKRDVTVRTSKGIVVILPDQ